MLSPLDLQNKKVVTKKRKYDKIEMDEYLDLIFENYKELYNQNQELQKQVKTLSDGVQYYRSIESTMQKALVLAEKTSKETKDAALLKAEAIEKDANSKAAKIISQAEQEYETIKDKCLYLVQQFNQYKMQLRQVATAQLELITSDSFDVYSPELDKIQKSRALEDTSETAEKDADSFDLKANSSPSDSDSDISLASTDEDDNVSVVSSLEDEGAMSEITGFHEEDSDLGKTTVLPDIKKELEKEKTVISEEDELSILTADTIDLRESIEQVQQKENENDHIVRPKNANVKEVETAQFVTPLDAETVAPLDIQLQDANVSQPEILEPVQQQSEKDAPTLDSLLQNMNLGKKNKKKKGQEEDPFEFLGSVDDF